MAQERKDDVVSAAFDTMRAAAKQRNGHVPNLHKQGRNPLPRRAVVKPREEGGEDWTLIPGVTQFHELTKREQGSVGKKRRTATGPDGRRLRRTLNVPRMGAVISKEIAERGWENNLAEGWVSNHWAELVGDKIAQHTKVEMIKDQQVFITCDSTAWATNLKYMQRTILQTIAQKVGPNVIVGLKIFGPKPPSWRKGPLHVKGRGPRDTYG